MTLKNAETHLSETITQPAHRDFIIDLLNTESHGGQNLMMVGQQYVQLAESLTLAFLEELIRKIKAIEKPPVPENHLETALNTLQELKNYMENLPTTETQNLSGDWNFIFDTDRRFKRNRIFRKLSPFIPEFNLFLGMENGIIEKKIIETFVIENGAMRRFEKQDNENRDIMKHFLFYAINKNEHQAYIHYRNNPGPLIGSGYEVIYENINHQPAVSAKISEWRS